MNQQFITVLSKSTRRFYASASTARRLRQSFIVASMAAVLNCAAAPAAFDDHWPQWRGPQQNGVAPKGNPPTEWSETKNVKWKVKLPGEGRSTPVIWGDRIFVLAAVPTGKKVEPNPAQAAASSTDGGGQRRPPGGGAGPGGPGGGPGFGPPGGPGGFGPGNFFASQMLATGDKNQDQKLSRDEFAGIADTWFEKLDTDKAGKLDQETFAQRFGNVASPAPGGAPPPEGDGPGGGRRGGRGGGPARFMAPGFFSAVDADKNGSLTREELKSTFGKWFAEWDRTKSGSLSEDQLRQGLTAALPAPQFGGPGGPGGPGGGGRRGGFGGTPPTEVHQFVVMCLDRQTGKTIWQKTAREELPHEGKHNDGSFAALSPVTDGKNVYASFGSRGLYCYDMEGNLKWSQDLGDMRISNSFGEGSSPVVHGDTLIVKWDHEGESFIAALDRNTGKQIWKQPREERTSWSTPLIVEHEGKTQVVTSATGKIRSYDLANGQLIWECEGLTANVIPSPVAGNGMVYLMSGFRGYEAVAIRLGRTGNLTGTDAIVWTHDRATPYVPSPLLYGDKLYFFSSNNGVLSSFNALNGKPNFAEQRLEALRGVYASPVGAANRVYLVGREGTALVLRQSDTLDILATNKLDDRFDASPAIAGKELFLRGLEHLYCLAEM